MRDLRFSYAFDVSEDPTRLSGRVFSSKDHPLPPLGESPTLTWVAVTPAPWKLYARVTMRATGSSAISGVTVTVDRGLMTVLRPGDLLFFCAVPGLGLSIVRDGLLIAAAGLSGALFRIPLGEVLLQLPDPADVQRRVRCFCSVSDQKSVYPVRPVQVTIGEESSAFWWGRPTIGPIETFFRAGRDRRPLLSMERKHVCPETSAHTSASLMERHGLEILAPA